MKYKREDKVKILEYKFIFEEELQVKQEYAQGTADLNYRLSFFRNKLNKQRNSKEKKERYDKTFMGGLPNEHTSIEESNDEIYEIVPKSYDSSQPWTKTVYRKIVMVTHPDKTSEISSKNLKDKLTEQYRITQNAYNNKTYSDLIMVAYDLNIGVPEHVINEQITPSSAKKKNNIDRIKKLLGWQWYHIPEDKRDDELKRILSIYGFDFSDQEVEQVVRRKYIKRKVGTRPEKINVKRRISK